MPRLNRNGAATVRARVLFAALALLVSLTALFPAAFADIDGMLRVKLTRLGSPSVIEMQADCDYCLASDPATRIPAGTTLRLSASRGGLVLSAGGRTATLGASATLARTSSGAHGMRFITPALSNCFCGDLEFTASGSAISTVLHIYIEDYLCGAVGYEMAPSSGLEALKAQAVASRSYALRQKSSHASAAYDLTDTADALAFKGYSAADEYAEAVKAVQATRGSVLYYGDSPAVCYTCESNGGQTESAANAFGTALNYSVVMDDPYDLDGAGAKKTAIVRKDAAELNPSLQSALAAGAANQLEALGLSADAADIRIDAIERVTACDSRYAAPSRLYKSLTFQLAVTGKNARGEAQGASVSVSVPTYGAFESWYGLGINAENNETVWVAETDRAFEITFRRSGHGVGMSQKGAQVMARSGRTCAEILQYYYPGTTLRQLSLADAARDDGGTAKAAEPIAQARLNEKTGLYERADDSAAALTELPAGATVDVYAVQDGWAAVGSGGRYGFVRVGALTVETEGGAADDDITVAGDDVYAQLTSDAGLYVNADDSVSPRQTLASGSYVQVLAYNSTWAYVRTPEDSQGYVKLDRLAAAQPPEEGGIDGGTITVISGGRDAWVQAAALPVYRSYDEKSDVLLTLTEGEKVTVGAYNAKWACVRADGVTGFVLLSGLSDHEPGDEAPDDGGAVTRVSGKRYAAVVRDGAPLYETWSDDAFKLATLSQGERVQVGAYNSKWACVRVDSVTGYMRVDDLELVSSPAEDSDSGVSYLECEAVTTTALGLYPTAGLDGDPVAQLEEGVQVYVLAYNDRAAYVEYKGQRGFAALRYLRKLQ